MDEQQEMPPAQIDIQNLWEKYEDIAMHFNDLLMRLRSQSLAGIAAIATLVGIFAKEDVSGFQIDWLAATAILVALALFWIAIFFLDIFYYNRLLGGAVDAIKQLESRSLSGTARDLGINMSTIIDRKFERWFPKFN
ncbi:MAG: hypothetical protein KGR48_17235, partial [Alphaproteobacteria bacterium]|nr:hypothetical protein [Alphaproteobacteria bacterium]